MFRKLYRKIKKIKRKILYLNEKDICFWIEKIIQNNRIQVVQIGSNDGKTGDPIFELLKKNSNWNALFVEPIPYLFEKLIQNYQNQKRFKFENSAINDGSSQIFYYVNRDAINKETDLPNWYDQLGGFNRSHIENQLNGRLKKYILEMSITGISFSDLLFKHNISKIDFLHIDTEGYDWKILSQLNLNEYNPSIILFEHKHLSESEKISALNFLKSNYGVYNMDDDFLCIKRDLINEKIKLKRRMVV